MSPIQIALLVLAIAGVWAIAELALTLRKTRTVVDSLDKTVTDLNNTIAEAQPVVAKLDGAVDELTPALAQIEPLLKSSKTAVDALTSNLVEVEAVVRDISEVTGSMAEASNAVSSVTDSAAGAVQKLFNKVKAPAADAERKLAAAAAEAEQPTERVELDFSQVPYIDSTGIGVLVGAARRASDRKRTLSITGAQPNVLRVAQLLGVDKDISISAA